MTVGGPGADAVAADPADRDLARSPGVPVRTGTARTRAPGGTLGSQYFASSHMRSNGRAVNGSRHRHVVVSGTPPVSQAGDARLASSPAGGAG